MIVSIELASHLSEGGERWRLLWDPVGQRVDLQHQNHPEQIEVDADRWIDVKMVAVTPRELGIGYVVDVGSGVGRVTNPLDALAVLSFIVERRLAKDRERSSRDPRYPSDEIARVGVAALDLPCDRVLVSKAQPSAPDVPVRSVAILIGGAGEFPSYASARGLPTKLLLESIADRQDREASLIVRALHEHLPGGTFCRVVAGLLALKASHFVVGHAGFTYRVPAGVREEVVDARLEALALRTGLHEALDALEMASEAGSAPEPERDQRERLRFLAGSRPRLGVAADEFSSASARTLAASLRDSFDARGAESTRLQAADCLDLAAGVVLLFRERSSVLEREVAYLRQSLALARERFRSEMGPGSSSASSGDSSDPGSRDESLTWQELACQLRALAKDVEDPLVLDKVVVVRVDDGEKLHVGSLRSIQVDHDGLTLDGGGGIGEASCWKEICP